MSGEPKVSVVVATHNRAGRLEALLESLQRQTLGPDSFEVLVVDDASHDDTPALLAAAESSGPLRLQVVRRDRAGGPAAARNDGWRRASAPLVAFTDDDCVVAPGWLEAGLGAADGTRVAIQGRTDPDPLEFELRSPFSRTLRIHSAGPAYETCNMFYPRTLLEELDGFDEGAFPVGGEDTDLAWRARERGVEIRFSEDAQVFHAVAESGPVGMLRYALRWQHVIELFARHPGLRREQLVHGLFWSPSHAHLVRFVAAGLLWRRFPVVATLLARPYLMRLVWRRSRGLLAPWILLYDVVETFAVVRGAIRNRVPVI